MRRDYIPCNKIPLEDILIKNKYITDNDNTSIWETLIHKQFCKKRDKKGNLCLNKNINFSECVKDMNLK